MTRPLNIVFIGLSISSSWGNGHATTYRSLMRGLAAEGHKLQSFKAAMRNTDEVVRATVRPHPRPRPPSR